MSLEELQCLISNKFSADDLNNIVENYAELDQICIGKICITPSDQKIGDSYLSKIVRFTVNATGVNKRGINEAVTVNVIAKVLPQNLGRRNTFRSKDFFENEIIFYDKVWSSLKKFYESKNVKEFEGMIPLCLAFYFDGEHDFICLEDISYKNFENVERGNGIDYTYAIQAIDLLAKFHSLSLAYKDQKPKEFTEIAGSLKETYFSERLYSWYGKLQKNLFILVLDAVQRELPKLYYDKIDQVFKNNFFKKASEICESNHCHLSGVTEGDAWIPNFLFQKDTDGKLNVALIDFQLTRWAPFSNDLTFFLTTCVEQNLLEKHWDDFLNEYVIRMKKYLTLLGSSPALIEMEELNSSIKQNIYYTLAMLIEALPMSLIEGFDLDIIKGDEAVPLESIWILPAFEDEEKRKKVANSIKFIVDKGYL